MVLTRVPRYVRVDQIRVGARHLLLQERLEFVQRPLRALGQPEHDNLVTESLIGPGLLGGALPDVTATGSVAHATSVMAAL